MRIFLSGLLLLGLAGAAYAVELAAPDIKHVSLDGEELRFEFDRPMQTWATIARQPNIRISPEVECDWIWEDDTSLVCGAYKKTKKFKPATYYQLEIGEGFLSQEGAGLPAKSVRVNSPGPSLRAKILEWENTRPIIVIEPSLMADADSIKKYLTVTINGKKIPYDLNIRKGAVVDDEDDERRVQYALELGKITDRDALLKISVTPGLKSTIGPAPSVQDGVILFAKINESFRLNSVSCQNADKNTEVSDEKLKSGTMQCDPETSIALQFSNTLSEASYSRLTASLPKGFSLNKKGVEHFYYYNRDQALPEVATRQIYYLKSDSADTRFLLKFPESIVNVEGELLENPPELLFDIGDYASKFKLTTSASILLLGEKSGIKLDVMNSPIENTRVGQLQISDGAREQIRKISLAGTKNKIQQVDMPAVNKNIQANGGLSLFGSEEIRGIDFGVAYVPFNVLSYQSSSQVIVWATQWQSGLPVEGAEVDILRLDANRKLESIAVGTTDRDGVAKINLAPSLILLDDLMSFVRVKSHGKTVVSPALRESNTDLNFNSGSHYHWYQSSNRRRALLSFGVTELPLYRPGENVNYRLWLREKVGNHLQKTGRALLGELRLYDTYNEKTLQTWQSPLDANDSVSSNLTLSRLLPDGYYCINAEESENEPIGACFQVARFDSQPLWATMTADKKSALAGQVIKFEMESGYFSGGPAANIELKLIGLSTWRRIEEQYPEFAKFSFINSDAYDSYADGGNPLKGLVLPSKTDAKGTASFELRLDKPISSGSDRAPPIAFGLLELSAEVKIAGKASANSSSVAINYAQYPRYVGLKTQEWWLRIDKDPELEAVVLTYDGKPVAKQSVVVKIYEDQNTTSKEVDKKAGQKLVGECSLISGEKSLCNFRASKQGRYVFKAESEGAASTEIIRYIGETYTTDNPEEKPYASLKLVQASDGNSPAKVLLDQPFENAIALLTLEYEQIVYHWVQKLDKKQTEISIPVRQAWAPGLSVRAIIRPANNSSAQAGKKIDTLDALLDIDIPRLQSTALLVATIKDEYRPGEEIEIAITNPSAQARAATLSVIDDSVYQQGSEVWSYQDPSNKNWLGTLSDWQVSTWYGIEALGSVENIFFNKAVSAGIRRNVEDESSSAVHIVTKAEIEAHGLANVGDVLNGLVASDDSGLPAAALSVGNARYYDNGDREIEKVTVTGSRISRAESYQRAPAVNIAGIKKKSASGKPKPRMRSQFMDAAYWNPDIVLAPRETKIVKFKLPDNFTQWRVLVWGSDSSDGFSLTQSTFKTNLPIEVRAGLPSQLFVGDKTRAQISARNQSEHAVAISMNTLLAGAGVTLNKSSEGKVAAYDALTQALDFKVTEPGGIDIGTIADSAIGSDGLSTSGFVQSRMGQEQVTQSGWLDESMLDLKIPKLPASAINAKLDVEVSRGFSRWTNGWLQDLQEYPHRCWEQTLSRAIGAAYADKYDAKSMWTDRKETVNDALQVATSFKDEQGYYHYFQNESFEWTRVPNIALSAYTLKGFNYLKTLGYPVQEVEVIELEKNLAREVGLIETWKPGQELPSWETLATAAGAVEKAENIDSAALTTIWTNWETLSWFARSELVLAMSRKPELKVQTQEGIQQLQGAGERKGLQQIINEQRDFSFYMGSDLRDQCAVVGALFRLDSSAEGKPARERLLRGIYDVYAGGTASLDTQSSAQCLMVLHEVTRTNVGMNGELPIKLGLNNQMQSLAIAAATQSLNWQTPIASSAKSLQIQAANNSSGSLNYNATIDYEFDLQQAQAKGTGISLQRAYDVLKGNKWLPVQKGAVKEGDWIRIRLLVTVPRARHFVAVSDFAPGGFVTRDITLSSVGGANAAKIGGNGSYYFDSRQTGSSVVRIYAEYLPAGRHEIYYYAQAVHPGEYFAPPAIAELMYGRASRANTSADRVMVQESK